VEYLERCPAAAEKMQGSWGAGELGSWGKYNLASQNKPPRIADSTTCPTTSCHAQVLQQTLAISAPALSKSKN